MRGDHFTILEVKSEEEGPTPHARGAVAQRRPGPHRDETNPAGAGSSRTWAIKPGHVGTIPTGTGSRHELLHPSQLKPGSSPRGRGPLADGTICGAIPALTGQSGSLWHVLDSFSNACKAAHYSCDVPTSPHRGNTNDRDRSTSCQEAEDLVRRLPLKVQDTAHHLARDNT